jgi:putative oxidoreductase
MLSNPSITERRLIERRVIDDDDDEVIRDSIELPSSGWQPMMALIGRFLIAAIFLTSGIAKLTDTPATVAHMVKIGIPYADTLALVAGAAEVLGAISLVLGLLTRAGAFGLILFMIPTTLIFHAFWNYQGEAHMQQMVNFMKNVAIIGGLAALAGLGAGRFSVDHLVRRSRTR